MPRSHTRAAPAAVAKPLAGKRQTVEAARELAARRRAALGAWLASITAGARQRVADLALHGPDDPRRWLDVARAAHLGNGRELRAAGFAFELEEGEVRLGDDTCGLAAPDGWIGPMDPRRR